MPINNGHFRLEELTASINSIPPVPGRVTELGLFQGRGIALTTAVMERFNGGFQIAKEVEPGAPSEMVGQEVRDSFSFQVPLYRQARAVRAEDVQDRRAFGSFNAPMPMEEEERRALERLRRNYDVSVEAQRASALQGILLNGDGSTRINFFTQLGVTQKSINFALGTATTNINGKIAEAIRHIRNNINGDVIRGYRALCGPTWFQALKDHAKVQDKYLSFQDARQMRENPLSAFPFGGVIWEEYSLTATESDGGTRVIVPDNEAIIFPEGTMDTFDEVWAPVDYTEVANTAGLPLYASTYMRDNSPSSPRIIEAAWRPLPYCKRPQVLVKATSS